MEKLIVDEFITDNPIYKRALTLANHGKSALYERLEFLGDRVLGVILADILYHRFPKEKEGDWAMRFTILAQERTLAEIARRIGLPHKLITPDPYLCFNTSILADVCEAVIAAIYLDQGLERARQFVQSQWEPFIEQSKDNIKDPKSALQEWAQKQGKMPKYEVIDREGPDHAPLFTVQVSIPDAGDARAIGSSKKEAQQEAAKLLLLHLNNA